MASVGGLEKMSTSLHSEKGREKRKGILKLLISICLLLTFLYGVGPWLEQLPLFRPIVELIDARDIDAGAYYYTDIEEFSDAEHNIRHSMAYPPALIP